MCQHKTPIIPVGCVLPHGGPGLKVWLLLQLATIHVGQRSLTLLGAHSERAAFAGRTARQEWLLGKEVKR